MAGTAPETLLDPVLQAGYRRCAELTRQHGTTYFWGAAILPREQRRHVHAVYALCRLADDIVDAPGATTPARAAATEAELRAFQRRFITAVADGGSKDPVLAAVATTVTETGIEAECFDRFFDAMAQDLTVDHYPTWDDLLGYMEGSAAVIGEMMLPVLQPLSPAAKEPARNLGLAFQLADDALDYGGATETLGKNAGDDFREGKATLPLLLAIARSGPREAEFWERAIGRREQHRQDAAQRGGEAHRHQQPRGGQLLLASQPHQDRQHLERMLDGVGGGGAGLGGGGGDHQPRWLAPDRGERRAGGRLSGEYVYP